MTMSICSFVRLNPSGGVERIEIQGLNNGYLFLSSPFIFLPANLLDSSRRHILVHCVQKKTPTHIFFYISMSDV